MCTNPCFDIQSYFNLHFHWQCNLRFTVTRNVSFKRALLLIAFNIHSLKLVKIGFNDRTTSINLQKKHLAYSYQPLFLLAEFVSWHQKISHSNPYILPLSSANLFSNSVQGQSSQKDLYGALC